MAKIRPHKIEQGGPLGIVLTGTNGCTNVSMRLDDELVGIIIQEAARMPGMSHYLTQSFFAAAAEYLGKGRGTRRCWPETCDHIKAGFAAFFGMTWEQLTVPNKHSVFVDVRAQIYLYLSADYDAPEIEMFFVPRHRTTILEGIETAKSRYKLEAGFKFKADLLSKHMQEWTFGG